MFDCDGVLVDSELLSCRAMADALREQGLDADVPYVIEHFLGRSIDVVRRHAHERGVRLREDFEQRLHATQLQSFKHNLRPIPGMARLLERLDVATCVASSSALVRVRYSLQVAGLADYFGANVFTAEMVAQGKPAPDLFLFAAAGMGVAADRCIVVEDSISGVRAARAAGMTAWGFTGGAHHAGAEEVARALIHSGASRVFTQMDDVAEELCGTVARCEGG
ncbi:MAG: HAD family hydrolase [Rhodanobacter sp.]|nr:MAG: HAD family hydrolase [Rhodanobacter sp.]